MNVNRKIVAESANTVSSTAGESKEVNGMMQNLIRCGCSRFGSRCGTSRTGSAESHTELLKNPQNPSSLPEAGAAAVNGSHHGYVVHGAQVVPGTLNLNLAPFGGHHLGVSLLLGDLWSTYSAGIQVHQPLLRWFPAKTQGHMCPPTFFRVFIIYPWPKNGTRLFGWFPFS